MAKAKARFDIFNSMELNQALDEGAKVLQIVVVQDVPGEPAVWGTLYVPHHYSTKAPEVDLDPGVHP